MARKSLHFAPDVFVLYDITYDEKGPAYVIGVPSMIQTPALLSKEPEAVRMKLLEFRKAQKTVVVRVVNKLTGNAKSCIGTVVELSENMDDLISRKEALLGKEPFSSSISDGDMFEEEAIESDDNALDIGGEESGKNVEHRKEKTYATLKNVTVGNGSPEKEASPGVMRDEQPVTYEEMRRQRWTKFSDKISKGNIPEIDEERITGSCVSPPPQPVSQNQNRTLHDYPRTKTSAEQEQEQVSQQGREETDEGEDSEDVLEDNLTLQIMEETDINKLRGITLQLPVFTKSPGDLNQIRFKSRFKSNAGDLRFTI